MASTAARTVRSKDVTARWGRAGRSPTVFTYDRRGRGDSGDTPPYAVEHEIDDVEALLNEAGGALTHRAAAHGAKMLSKNEKGRAHSSAPDRLAAWEARERLMETTPLIDGLSRTGNARARGALRGRWKTFDQATQERQ